MLQLYPTIQNLDSIINETVERKKESNQKEYNEVVIKNTEPIGIFYKGNYDELDEITKSYVEKLKMKYPNLRVIGFPNQLKNINNNEVFLQHPKAKELNELEKQKQIAKQNNNEQLYNQLQQQIYQIIYNNRMEIEPEKWDSLDIESKLKFLNIKLKEAHILGDKDEFNYWNKVIKSLNEKQDLSRNEKINQKVSLEELKNSVGNTDGYTILVHGTHFTDEEVKNLIFTEGLRTTGTNEKTSLEFTTKPLDIDSYSSEELKEKFENYDHNNRNMIIIKLPNEYFNVYDYTGDRDCRKTRAFMKDKVLVEGGYKYLLDPKFIVGSYNTETMEATLNNSFERELSPETRMMLKNNLISLQKEIGIDPKYIETINSDDVIDKTSPSYNSSPVVNESTNDYQDMIQELESKKDYNYYFDEMIKAAQKYNPNEQITEEQKKQLIGEIFYNEDYLIESLTNDEEIRQIMTRSVNELSNNEMQVRLQNIVLTEMQEKYKQLHPEIQQEKIKQEEDVSNNKSDNNNELDLSGLINQLRLELNQVQNAYRSMLSDGYIDDEELARLLGMINKVINDGYSLKTLATNPSDLKVISLIINSLEEEQKKMNKMQNGIEEIGKTMR
jgi:hypothetical protein